MNTADQNLVHRVLVVAGIVSLFAIVWVLFATAADVFLVIFAGVLFAIFLRGLADTLSRVIPLAPRWSLVIVLLALTLLLALGAMYLAGEIANQLGQIGERLTQAWRALQEKLQAQPWGKQVLSLASFEQSASGQEGGIGSQLARVFSTTLGAMVNIMVILFIAIYIAFDPDWYRAGMLRILPPAQRRRGDEVVQAIGHSLRWWLLGRITGMLAVGIATTVGLWLLGMPLALGLGVLAFLFDFVPTFGPILAAIPAVLLALTVGPQMAIYVVLLYTAIQFLEGYVLTPLIEQRSVRLPPALTISAQILMGVLLGGLGFVLATPLTAAVVVLIKKLYVEDALGEPTK